MEEQKDIAMGQNLSKLLNIEFDIQEKELGVVTVLGRKFSIKDTPRATMNKIIKLGARVQVAMEGKDEKDTGKYIKSIKNIDVKCASYLLLNNVIKIFLFHWFYWRWLAMRYSSETFSGVLQKNFNNKETLFFYSNCAWIAQVVGSRKMMMKATMEQ